MSENQPIPLTILSPVANRRHPLNAQSIDAIASCGAFAVTLFEVFGVSEVARARNIVATDAFDHVSQTGGIVLWLDSDMTATPAEVILQARLVQLSRRAISGRAVMRNEPTKIAASLEEGSTRIQRLEKGENISAILTPILSGLACLMLPASLFLKQAAAAPVQRRPEGPIERLVCCPRIEAHPTMGHVWISEDHAYSKTIEGGAWLAYVQGDRESWLDYGHIGEQIAKHAPTPSHIREDLIK